MARVLTLATRDRVGVVEGFFLHGTDGLEIRVMSPHAYRRSPHAKKLPSKIEGQVLRDSTSTNEAPDVWK